MFTRLFRWCWSVITILVIAAAPLLAQEDVAEDETQTWVISYTVMVLFLALTLFFLLRPNKRSESAFSYDELQAQKEEELKKMKAG